MQDTYAILICTRDRAGDILLTLDKISPLLRRGDTVCVVYDDGSVDGTSEKVKASFPEVCLWRNDTPRGYLFCRNRMLAQTQAKYAVSLDDDAHFLSDRPLEAISGYFAHHPDCGVIAARIFWGKEGPHTTSSPDTPHQVMGFVGCGHAWRMDAWRKIPGYPEWFGFYGEEHFASLQLFRLGYSVDYVPDILVQHRVDLKARQTNTDDALRRYKYALRADWYNMFLFYPAAPRYRKMAYSLRAQLAKILKGRTALLRPLLSAIRDLAWRLPYIRSLGYRLTRQQYEAFMKLPPARIYWKP